jgi:hypothetical protein
VFSESNERRKNWHEMKKQKEEEEKEEKKNSRDGHYVIF